MERRLLLKEGMSLVSFLFGCLVLVAGCASYGEAEEPSASAQLVTATEGQNAQKKKKKPPTATADAPPPAASKSEPAPAKPASIAFSWNKVSDDAQYSLDAIMRSGVIVGPCIGVTTLGYDLTTTFDGHCVTPDIHLQMEDISDFRICWAEYDDWAHATCTSADWDGASSSVVFTNE
jgi:hypothetical protein